MDPEGLARAWTRYWRLARRYHRYGVEGLEHVLAHEGPALLVCYHGRPVAYDLFMLALSLEEATGRRPIGVVHATALHLPVISDLVTGLGWVAGDDEPLAAALAEGALVAVQPGGTREGCRSVRHRYRVDWGRRTGYLRLAVKHGLPLIPVACRGIDDGYIGLNDGYRLGKRVNMPGRLPLWFGLGPLGLWPWSPPFPVRLTQRIGAPISLEELGLSEASDKAQLLAAHERVTRTVQDLLDRPPLRERPS